jgi:hypothetical protein
MFAVSAYTAVVFPNSTQNVSLPSPVTILGGNFAKWKTNGCREELHNASSYDKLCVDTRGVLNNEEFGTEYVLYTSNGTLTAQMAYSVQGVVNQTYRVREYPTTTSRLILSITNTLCCGEDNPTHVNITVLPLHGHLLYRGRVLTDATMIDLKQALYYRPEVYYHNIHTPDRVGWRPTPESLLTFVNIYVMPTYSSLMFVHPVFPSTYHVNKSSSDNKFPLVYIPDPDHDEFPIAIVFKEGTNIGFVVNQTNHLNITFVRCCRTIEAFGSPSHVNTLLSDLNVTTDGPIYDDVLVLQVYKRPAGFSTEEFSETMDIPQLVLICNVTSDDQPPTYSRTDSIVLGVSIAFLCVLLCIVCVLPKSPPRKRPTKEPYKQRVKRYLENRTVWCI